MKELEEARKNFLLNEEYLSPFATKSSDALRLKAEKEDYRTPFSRDADRIIYSLSYTRYIDKTQVYSFKDNDHISKRIVHVQLVSKIARTIGRALKLNEDLIEAIGLGHDIGHTPLGHTGESFLNEISRRELNEYFCHNVQSVRNFLYVENNGKGSNLTIQTLDGLLCHNGEVLLQKYEPIHKTKDDFIEQYNNCYFDKNYNNIMPMTLEGCVVRISDIIAYIGRDIEDAINLGMLKREDIPQKITSILGNSNSEIINNIVSDIIVNSIGKPYIKLSSDVYQALQELMNFNYKYIYYKSMSTKDYDFYKESMEKLYKKYVNDIENENFSSDIYEIFLSKQSDEYNYNTKTKRKVLDFIAGMTDDYFIKCSKKIDL